MGACARRIASVTSLTDTFDDYYAVGVDNRSPVVSESLWSRVVLRCSEIRQRAAASESCA